MSNIFLIVPCYLANFKKNFTNPFMLYPVKDTDSNDENGGAYESKIVNVPEAFEEIFTFLYYAKNKSSEPITKRMIPTFQTILVFSLGSPINFSITNKQQVTVDNSVIIGPIRKPLEYTLTPGAEIIVANFKEDAFYRFFGQSLQSFNDFVAHPADIVKEDSFTDLWFSLKGTVLLSEKINKILAFSLPYLREREEVAASHVINKKADNIVIPTKDVSGGTDDSDRTVQLHYKKNFGYSDKEITRYQRFRKAVELVEEFIAAKADIDWFEIVYGCGYHDQTHLIHDFKYYIDVTPMQYVKLQDSIFMTRL